MDIRVDDLAARSGVSVDTIRYYQAQRLLDPPQRRGRNAFYSDEHVARLDRIRALQSKGLTLAAIGRVVSGELTGPDLELAAAVAESDGEQLLTIDDLAERTGVPVDMLAELERDGLLVGRPGGGFTGADVSAARAGMHMLATGIPMSDLVALAARHHAGAAATAKVAVDLFDRFVREPLRDSGLGEDEISERLVAAFQELLPAATELVAHHFRRLLLAAAEERIGGLR